MAVSLQVGDILAARVWCSLDDQAAVNTYNYSVITVTGGGITDQDFATNFDTLQATFYQTVLSPHGTYDGVQVYFVQRASGGLPAFVKSTAGAGPGTSGTNTCPPNTAYILAYTTNIRGPSGRGRLYLPFVSTGQVAPDGRATAGFDTFINSQCTLLLPPLTITSGGNSATLVWSLLHRHPKPAPFTTTQIIQAAGTGKFGQMHKRGSYGRPNASPI